MRRNRLGTYEGATGFILDWLMTGFFPNGTIGGEAPDLFQEKTSRNWQTDYLAPIGGEAAVRDIPAPAGLCALEWLPLQAPPHYPKLILYEHRRTYPELDRAWPERWDHQWYALAVLDSDAAQQAELRLCGHDGCRVWWNGEFLFQEHSWHKLAFDLHVLPVALRKGPNALLMKLDRFGLVARLTGAGGGRLKADVRTLTPALPRLDRFGTFAQLARYSRTLKVLLPCRARTKRQFLAWRRAARGHFRRCLGPFPKAPRSRARLVETVPCDGYTRFLYHLPREGGSLLPVHVLSPKPARFNGRTVICPHGHGQDDEVVAGITPPEHPYGNWFGPWTGNYAGRLAQAGFLTATWAERVLSHQRQDLAGERTCDPCNVAGLCAAAMGMTLPGLHLFDLHAVTDFVCRLPGADPRRIGLTGLSGGGTMTYLAGAYDDRFKALAPFCGLLSYATYARDGGCGQQVVPGLYPTLDVGELLGLCAPRPLLLGQGRRDVIFDVFLLQRFARQARRAYRALGAEGNVEVHLYDLSHQLDVEAAAEFFRRVL